jgi:hypothetical protein
MLHLCFFCGDEEHLGGLVLVLVALLVELQYTEYTEYTNEVRQE